MNTRIRFRPSDSEPSHAAPFAPSMAAALDSTGPLEAELTGPLYGADGFNDPMPHQPVATVIALQRGHEDTQRLDGNPGVGSVHLASDAAPQVDQTGRYHLEQRLGQGGVGTVWSAYDTVLARQVAVKTLTIAAAPGQREALAARVLDEARAAARLSHPHVVTVHDAGVSPEGAYIAMELLRGKDLAELLRSGWRPSPEQAAMIVRRVADALGYAHSKGVIHRDVKPANIFMVGRTRPVVLDFGIARLIHHDRDGPALGSPYYAAPEQYDGRECDPRSDVYSLGVVLYELLTGQRPYQGNSLDQIRNAVRQGRPLRPTLIIPSVPPALETLVMQAIDIDPAARPRSAGAMARELRAWLATLPNAPGAVTPQTPLNSAFDAPRGAHRAAGESPMRDRPASGVTSLPPAANPAHTPEAHPGTPSAPGSVGSATQTAGRNDALAAPAARPSIGSALTVAAVLSLLVLVGWLLLGRA